MGVSQAQVKGGIHHDKWNISHHTGKQNTSQSSVIAATPMVSWWAPRELRKERISAIQQLSDCSHSPWWTLRKLRMWKHGIPAPDRWGAYERNEARLLHLPIHRKYLNSLTWDVWFSCNNDLLMFRLPALCCNTSVWPDTPLASSEQFFQGWDAASRAWSPKNSTE